MCVCVCVCVCVCESVSACMCICLCTHVADGCGKGVDVRLQPVRSELIPDEGHSLLLVLGVGHVVPSL